MTRYSLSRADSTNSRWRRNGDAVARPKLTCERLEVRVHLWLRSPDDDDLIQFFQALPLRERANALKIALRAGGIQPVLEAEAEESKIDDLVSDLLM